MDDNKRPAPPPPPAFPAHLSAANNIWEEVDVDSDEEIDEEAPGVSISDQIASFDNEFKEDLENLENHWFKQAARLTSHLISPIHDAAAKGNLVKLKEIILEQGQNPNTRDNVQNTPLHYAAGAGHVDVVSWLLDNGADINATNLLGDTALHKATWRRYFDVVKVLCAKGVDRHKVNAQGHEALDLVRDVDIGAEIQSYDPAIPDDDEDNDAQSSGGEEDPQAL